MRSLQRLLGNDLAGLIYQKLHEMLMAQLLREYRANVFPRVGAVTNTFVSIHFLPFDRDYNARHQLTVRRLRATMAFRIREKHCTVVAELSKNY